MKRFVPFVAATALLIGASASHAAPRSCQLTFRLGTAAQFSSASVFAIYQNAFGDFPGDGVGVSCSLLGGGIGQVADANSTRTLTITLAGTPTPIQGPKDIAKCTWTPNTRDPVAGDFNLASQGGFKPFPDLSPLAPNITISKIECTGDPLTTTTTTTSTTTTSTTTSSTSTTTTLSPCGDFNGDGKYQTSDSLSVLRASVGQLACLLCVCDLDGNGKKGAPDALVSLKKAVGNAVTLKCPLCQ